MHENLQFSELDISARICPVHNHFPISDLPCLHPTIQRGGLPGNVFVPPLSVKSSNLSEEQERWSCLMSLSSKDWKEEPRTLAADFQAALGAHARPSSKHSFPRLSSFCSLLWPPCPWRQETRGSSLPHWRNWEGAPHPRKTLFSQPRHFHWQESRRSPRTACPGKTPSPPGLPPLLMSQPPPSSSWPPDLLFLWISYQKNSRAPNHVDISFSDPCPLLTPTPNFWNPLLYLSDHRANPQQNLCYPQPPRNHALRLTVTKSEDTASPAAPLNGGHFPPHTPYQQPDWRWDNSSLLLTTSSDLSSSQIRTPELRILHHHTVPLIPLGRSHPHWASSPHISTLIPQRFLLLAHCHSQSRQWHPTPVLLPGKSHGQRSLVGCSTWGR